MGPPESHLMVLLLRPFGPSHSTCERPQPRPHPRPRSTVTVYWWFRVRRTWTSRTARPCRRIAPATACGTRKSGTGEMFISSREEIPVAAWRSAWWHFMAGLPPLVLGSISPSSGVLLSCCMLVFSLHQDSARRMHHSREPLGELPRAFSGGASCFMANTCTTEM